MSGELAMTKDDPTTPTSTLQRIWLSVMASVHASAQAAWIFSIVDFSGPAAAHNPRTVEGTQIHIRPFWSSSPSKRSHFGEIPGVPRQGQER